MNTKLCLRCKGDGYEDIIVAFGGIIVCPNCKGEGKISIKKSELLIKR